MLLLSSGCGGTVGGVAARAVLADGDTALMQRWQAEGEWITVAANGGRTLRFDPAGTGVSVEDTASGTVWYSFPAERAADPIASGGNQDLLSAPLVFSYLDTSGRLQSASANELGIALGQFTFEAVENGVRVHYLIGESKKLYVVPTVATEKRMQQVCGSLSPEDAEQLMAYYRLVSLDDVTDAAERLLYVQQYPALEKQNVYVLSGITLGNQEYPEFLLETLEEFFIKAGYTAEQLQADNAENGIKTGDDTDYSIAVSMEYILENGELVVRVPAQSIVYNTKVMTVTSMTLLPFFGAAGTDTSGYMLVPDGCGALIDLNGDKTGIGAYEQPVYGSDETVAGQKTEAGDEPALRLPVFGLKAGAQSFLGVIESGAAHARLHADVSGRTTAYNQIYTSYELRAGMKQTNSILNISGGQVYQKEPVTADIQVRYLFQTGENADYLWMAEQYGDYLESTGQLTARTLPDTLPLQVTTVGAVEHETQRLGFPVKTNKALTTYQQAQDMLRTLQQEGVKSLSLCLTGWANGGISNRVNDRVKLLDVLGGKQDFLALNAYVQAQGIAFYPELELPYVTRYTKGFRVNRQAARDISNMAAYRYRYALSTLLRDTTQKRAIVSPSRYGAMTEGFLEDLTDLGVQGVSFGVSGTVLHSDFNEKAPIYRQQTAETVMAQMEKAETSGFQLAVDGANAYALKGVSLVKNIPSHSSGSYLFDRDVPFYAFVLHGRVQYASEPLNTAGSYRQEALRLAESGTAPAFQWIYADNLALKDTDSAYYSASFAAWQDEAVQLWKSLNEVCGDCNSVRVTGHRYVTETVTVTIYANGVHVYVNYGAEPTTVEGHRIEAESFIRIKEDAH